jgi:hypothetical protein
MINVLDTLDDPDEDSQIDDGPIDGDERESSSDSFTCDDCDLEPSLGSLDGRMSQLRWGQSDRQSWAYGSDCEHDEAEHEADEAEQEGGIEDLNHDGDDGPSPANADGAFGGVS